MAESFGPRQRRSSGELSTKARRAQGRASCDEAGGIDNIDEAPSTTEKSAAEGLRSAARRSQNMVRRKGEGGREKHGGWGEDGEGLPGPTFIGPKEGRGRRSSVEQQPLRVLVKPRGILGGQRSEMGQQESRASMRAIMWRFGEGITAA